MMRPAVYWRFASFAVAAGFVGLWQLISNLRLVSPVFFPVRTGHGLRWSAVSRAATSAPS